MRALIEDVKASPARRLVVVYAALVVLIDVVAALPGNPDFTGGWGFFVAVAVQALIVRSLCVDSSRGRSRSPCRCWRRSRSR